MYCVTVCTMLLFRGATISYLKYEEDYRGDKATNLSSKNIQDNE